MSGPWEKYSTPQPQAAASGPWSKYAQPAEAEAPGYLQNVGSALKKLGITALSEGSRSPMSLVAGLGENAAQVISGATAPIPAAVESALGGAGVPGMESYSRARDKHIFTPTTQFGQALSGATGAILSPVGEAIGAVKRGVAAGGEAIGLSPGDAEQMSEAGVDIGLMAAPAARLPKGARAAKAAAPPTTAELGQMAGAAYKRAESAGIVVSPQSFSGMKMKMLDMLEKEGIDPTLHPKTTAALKRVAETDGAVSLEKMETLRRIANDARASMDPADSRLASKVVDEIDDFVEGLTDRDVAAGDASQAAALKEARNLYSRKKKAEEIDRLMERAELSAPNFSASGLENAVRAEFRALAKNEGRMRRFTPEEQAAIKHVAQGGPIENGLRMFGKLAPTGAVSTAIGSGLGFITGGPAGALGLPLAALGSRQGATALTMRNARRAQELMRRGPQSSRQSASTGGGQSTNAAPPAAASGAQSMSREEQRRRALAAALAGR